MTKEELFDLVAPIVITGGADLLYMERARRAWARIQRTAPEDWGFYPKPDAALDIDLDFDLIYNDFALAAYDELFEEVVLAAADARGVELKPSYDYWGAKGFRLPHQQDGSKSIEMAGDSCGRYPWFETAALVLERVKEIKAYDYV